MGQSVGVRNEFPGPPQLAVSWRVEMTRLLSLLALSVFLALGTFADAFGREFIRVAICPFVNTSGIEDRDGWGDAIVEMLVDSMSLKTVTTYDSEDLIKHLRQLDKSRSDCANKEVALALGKRINADNVVYGTLGGQENVVKVDVKILEVESTWEGDLYSENIDEDEIVGVDEILRQKLIEALEIGSVQAIKKGTQSKLAFEYYARGRNSLYTVGETLSNDDDQTGVEATLRWYEKAIAADSQFVDVLLETGILYVMLADQSPSGRKKIEKGISFLRQAEKLAPDDEYLHQYLGYAFKEKGDISSAIKEYEKVIKLNPNFDTAHWMLGNILSDKTGEINRAINHLRTAIRINPANGSIHNSLGNALKKIGDLKGAIAEYQIAIEYDPRDASSYMNLAYALDDKGDLREADRAAKKAIELGQDRGDINFEYGKLLARRGEYKDGIRYLRRAISLGKGSAEGQYILAHVLIKEQELKEAIPVLEKVVSLDPKHGEAHLRLGSILGMFGRDARAFEHLSLAVKLLPNEATAKENLGIVTQRMKKREQLDGYGVFEFGMTVKEVEEIIEVIEKDDGGGHLLLKSKKEEVDYGATRQIYIFMDLKDRKAVIIKEIVDKKVSLESCLRRFDDTLVELENKYSGPDKISEIFELVAGWKNKLAEFAFRDGSGITLDMTITNNGCQISTDYDLTFRSVIR